MIYIASLVAAVILNLPQPQSTSVEDLSFLTGSWRGELGDSLVEETWLPPEKGNLTGVFRMTEGGSVSFVEIMTITETNVSTMYRLRHFNSALVPWADEIDGPMEAVVELVDEESVRLNMVNPAFGVEAMTYDREGDTLVGTVVFMDKNREPFSLTFERVGAE